MTAREDATLPQSTAPALGSSAESARSVLPAEEKPLALVVFLENVGHVLGLNLPHWTMRAIDYVTEEYAKILLHVHGAYRRYDRVVILEDADANGPALTNALVDCSRTHRVDVLLLVHGHEGKLVGHEGKVMVGMETFLPLLIAYRQNPGLLDIRAVYGLNCHGATLASMWIELGAEVVNGAAGVNWFPEPSLTVFLHNWLKGNSFSDAVQKSNRRADRVWRTILRNKPDQPPHPWISSSRQIVYGRRDISIDSKTNPEALT